MKTKSKRRTKIRHWEPDETDVLEMLVDDRWSSRAIAAVLLNAGTDRNMRRVGNKAYRMGISFRARRNDVKAARKRLRELQEDA